MGQKFLIDSNAIIDFLADKFSGKNLDFINEVIDAIPVTSGISKIEVLGFQTSPADQQILTSFFDDAIVIDLTNAVAEQTIAIRKSHKIKLPDAIIASTALVFNLTLISRNTYDFRKIDGLTIINPYEV